MNKTEALAYDWLIRRGYSPDEITFRRLRSPDFLTTDGKGWEVKFVRQGQVLFGHTQLPQLGEHPDVTVLIWNNGDPEPLDVIPFSEITVPGFRGSFHFVESGRFDQAPVRIGTDARLSAKVAAARAGITLEAWINRAIMEQARREGAAVNRKES